MGNTWKNSLQALMVMICLDGWACCTDAAPFSQIDVILAAGTCMAEVSAGFAPVPVNDRGLTLLLLGVGIVVLGWMHNRGRLR